MDIDVTKINAAISFLQSIRDGRPSSSMDIRTTDDIGEKITEIANGFMAAVTAVVATTMDKVLEDAPEKDAPNTFYDQLWGLFRRMMVREAKPH